jgi:hexulose-6-phosphate isomerase
MSPLDRRGFLAAGGALAAARLAGAAPRALAAPRRRAQGRARLRFAVKYGMVAGDAPMAEKLKLLKRLGFDGVELDSPADYDAATVRAAVEAAGLPVHGVVDSVHWQERLSSPDPEVRKRGTDALAGALRDARAFGGFSVLLVPGRVTDAEQENQQQVWERSRACVETVLPLAAELGVRILIENVWNGFCYVHDGPADQKAETLAAYVDSFASPWVGSYFDIGNHQKYARPAEWIRTLGRRIVKLDVKDWSKDKGFCAIGDGDIDWAEVRKALAEVGFTGWATAEVEGGGEKELAEIRGRMDKVLGG